jgi:hypothetical protein
MNSPNASPIPFPSRFLLRDGLIEERRRLLHEAELPRAERLLDRLGGMAPKRELEVVDRGRARSSRSR